MKRLLVVMVFLGLTSSVWALSDESKALIEQLRAKYKGTATLEGQPGAIVDLSGADKGSHLANDPEFSGKAPVNYQSNTPVDPALGVPLTLNADNALSMPDEAPQKTFKKKGKKGKKSKKPGKGKKAKAKKSKKIKK